MKISITFNQYKSGIKRKHNLRAQLCPNPWVDKNMYIFPGNKIEKKKGNYNIDNMITICCEAHSLIRNIL